MKTRKVNTCIFAAMAVAAFAMTGAMRADAAKQPAVSFRLAKWRAAHFDDAAKAKTQYETLRQLGCEVKQGAHSGHYDVSYRALKWRSVTMKTEREAREWAHWLAGTGFEILFIQPESAGHLETVAFRLTAWKTGHFDATPEVESDVDTLKVLGCEVKRSSHGGHHDVSYRSPEWRTIGVESHGDADRWNKWLKAKGFETVHEHDDAQRRQTTARRR